MFKKIFLIMVLGFISGCGVNIKHPSDIKKSFLMIEKSIKVEVCGANSISKSNECKTVMTMRSSGSGSIVWNELELGKKPRTLVLTANHVCETEKITVNSFDKSFLKHVRGNLGFHGDFTIRTEPKMTVVDHLGNKYTATTDAWASDVQSDTCIVETSMNGPALTIGSKPSYGDVLFNVAAPKGIFYANSRGGGIFYADGLYNGEFLMPSKKGKQDKLFAMYTISAAPGSSGSPVVNKNGEIIGMIHSIDSRYCCPLSGLCNSPMSYGATLEQVRGTLLEALAAIKRGDKIKFDYKRVNQ